MMDLNLIKEECKKKEERILIDMKKKYNEEMEKMLAEKE